MNLTFGKEQIFASQRMRNNPVIAKMVSSIFGYTNIGNYARYTIFKEELKTLPYKKFKKILDLGCGYGEYSFALARLLNRAKVYAMDISTERTDTVRMVKDKELQTNLIIRNKCIEELEEQNFDFIYSIDVFEHIDPAEMPFKTVYSKLKPGGFFLLKIPNVKQKTILPSGLFEEHEEWLEDEHIGQVYDLKGLIERMKSEGFKIVSASNTDGYLSRFAWELGYLAKKLGTISHLISLR